MAFGTNFFAAAQIFEFVDLTLNKIVLRSTFMNINGKIKLLALLDIFVKCVGFEITCLFVYWLYQGISPTRQGQTSEAKHEESIRLV
jgi:hypothetical protein